MYFEDNLGINGVKIRLERWKINERRKNPDYR